MSNPVLLEGILRNLVRNAVKYTEPGGRILIGCRRSEETSESTSTTRGWAWRRSTCRKSSKPFKDWIRRAPTVSASACSWCGERSQLLGHRVEVRSQVGRGSRFSVFARAAG